MTSNTLNRQARFLWDSIEDYFEKEGALNPNKCAHLFINVGEWEKASDLKTQRPELFKVKEKTSE